MKREKIIIVGVQKKGKPPHVVEEDLSELEGLVKAAGGEVVARVIQKRDRIDPGYFIGKGKVEEIKRLADELQADAVIFDDPLRGVQQRNLEERLRIKVLDRTRLIMDIFAQRAKTSEGKIQVELAQLQHALTMLVGRGKELSRLGGGIGTRGPGEKQLEVDRRKILRRIQKLREELEKIRQRRSIQRKRRKGTVTFSLVGYTNAGKSTLLRALTHDPDVFVKDQLFSTLEARVRKTYLPDYGEVLVSDTVGFIRKIPHQLIEAFKATLEEVVESDALIMVIDSTWKNLDVQIETVLNTLKEIGAGDKPTIYFFNKIDLLSEVDQERIRKIAGSYPSGTVGSAVTREGLDDLKATMKEIAESLTRTKEKEGSSIEVEGI